MTKELEALDKLAKQIELDEDADFWEIKNAHKIVEKALLELQSIKEAKPSEAMGELETLKEMLNEFVKHNLIDKAFTTIKQALLKAEKQEKAWGIVKEKCLHTDNLNYVAVCINYDMYKEKMRQKHDTKVVKIDWNDKFVLDCLKLLTQEEFDLLKEMTK